MVAADAKDIIDTMTYGDSKLTHGMSAGVDDDNFVEPEVFQPKGTVLITGGCGFIGGHTAEKLMKRGNRVVSLDNLTPYYDVSYKRECLGILEGYGSELFRFAECDITDKAGMQKVFADEKPEVGSDSFIFLLSRCVLINMLFIR